MNKNIAISEDQWNKINKEIKPIKLSTSYKKEKEYQLELQYQKTKEFMNNLIGKNKIYELH